MRKILWVAVLFCCISIANALVSEEPERYTFWDNGDQIMINGSINLNPVNGQNLTSQHYTTLHKTANYTSTTFKYGNMSINVSGSNYTQSNYMYLGPERQNFTAAFSFYDFDTNAAQYGYVGLYNDVMTAQALVGVYYGVSNTEYFCYTGDIEDTTGITRINGWVNFSFYVDDTDDVGITFYVNGTNATNCYDKVTDGISYIGFAAIHDQTTPTKNITFLLDNIRVWNGTINNLPQQRPQLSISIYDEESNSLIDYTTVDVIADSDSRRITDSTLSGLITFTNLEEINYDISASTSLHEQRHYYQTIDELYETLDIYLLNSSVGATITFTIKNQKDEPLENAFMTVYNKVGADYIIVEQKYSDFAGQIKTFLNPDTKYRFVLSKSGYTTKTFDLEPSSSSYNIIMQEEEAYDFTTIFNEVSFKTYPTSTLINRSGDINLSLVTISTGGFISYYGINTSVNGTNYKVNTTGTTGGTTSLNINLSNPDLNISLLSVDYFIKTSDKSIYTINRNFLIRNVTYGNYSVVNVLDKYKGDFSEMLRIIISVFLTVLMVAVLAELGVPRYVYGLGGMFVIVIMTYFGWMPGYLTTMIGIILIGMMFVRGGDY